MSDPRDQRRLYGELAWLWPTMSPPEHYRDECLVYAGLLRETARRPVETILHLGCGGGHIDHWLRAEFRVTGLDISEAMLANARRLNPDVHYRIGDMRTARLGEAFDAVCLFDSVDYMLSEADLGAAFATAFAHLAPGGAFITYAELLRDTFKPNETKTATLQSDDLVLTYVENTFDPDPSDTTVETTYVYLIREAGTLRVETDRHLAGLFPRATWHRLLGEAGFEARAVAAELWPEGFDDPVVFVGVRPA